MTAVPIGTPVAEIDLTVDLVRNLLLNQHPDLAHLPIEPADEGWDNAMFRLGKQLAIRLPRRQVAATLIEKEQRWLPELETRLPIAIPCPIRLGRPSHSYPWPWSIIPWLPGMPADLSEPHQDQAPRFAEFLRALHRPAPESAPVNPFRGVPLPNRAGVVEERMRRLEGRTNAVTPEVKKLWNVALSAPPANANRWVHGDLHAKNVLVQDGILTGIIDWGDLTAGDIATDLASVWMLFPDPRVRRTVFDLLENLSEADIQRARGWAILFGIMLLDSGLIDHPRHAAIGEKTLRRVAKD